MTMLWIIAIGMLTLGGYCLCCGCSHCSDATDTESIQIDVSGILANVDSTSCCTNLNRSYAAARTSTCTFAVTYNNGACGTNDCTYCDSTDCTIVCDTGSTTVCNPNVASPYATCSSNGVVTYGTQCVNCDNTELATINYLPGSNSSACNVVGCNVSAQIWDVDVMIVDHPEATWAVAGDPVYYCNCTANDCTTSVGNSSMSWGIVIGASGGDVRLTLSGGYLTGTFAGSYTFTGAGDPIACATEMNALALTVGFGSDVEFTFPPAVSNLCNAPSSIELTYIP